MQVDGEESRLLKDASTGGSKNHDFLKNFIVMVTFFGFAHASVQVALAYATSVFDLLLGTYSKGFMAASSAITALLLANPIVEGFGARESLLLAQGCYLIYMVCFVVATGLNVETDDALQWALVITGSLIGGFAASLSAVAQGTYYGVSAASHAKAEGTSQSAANDLFAGYFGAIYVGIQALLYLTSSLLLQFTDFNDVDLFVVYTIITFLSVVASTLLLQPLDRGTDISDVDTNRSPFAHAMAVLGMLTKPRALSLLPLGVAFGFAATFASSYVNSRIVSADLGVYAVGYCGVIETATVALLSFPFSWLAEISGKALCIGIGSAATVAFAVAIMANTNKELGHWDAVAPLFVVYGIGRATFENTTKAVFADLFTVSSLTPAFAYLTFVKGVSASLYAFIISDVSRLDLTVIVIVPACFMLPGYLAAKASPSLNI